MSTQAKPFLTPEQYLEIERKAEFKSEYYQGEMFAMSGARYAHTVVGGNIFAALHQQLRHAPCTVSSSDLRVLVSATGLYTYPDVVVVCGEPKFLDGHFDVLLNPILLVEVLSPSTEAYDRGRKFKHYRAIESLQAYLMVSSDLVQADLYTRQPDGGWLLTSASRLEDVISLPSIACQLKLADLYEKVDFSAQSATDPR
jgi:Uma2 family endonuclease